MENQHDSITGEILTRIVLVIVGLIMFIPAANKLSTYCSLRFFGTNTDGIVTHSSSSRDLGGRPLIQYSDGEGGIYEFKSKAKTHWFKRPAVGEKIDVFFDKNNPTMVVVNNLFYYVFLPLIFIIAGSYCCYKSLRLHHSRKTRLEAS